MATTTLPLAPKKRRGGTPYVISRAVHLIATGEAFTDRRLSTSARAVLAVVVSRASCTDAGAPRWPGREYIAKRLRCSERTAIRRIGELVQAGLVEYAGQARSRANGRFLNGHLRLTRRACEVLALPWLSIPGPETAEALDRITVIPTRSSGTARAPGADRAGPANCGQVAPEPVRGDTIGTRPVVAPPLRSGHLKATSLVQKQPPAPAHRRGFAYDSAFVTVGAHRLPRELLWMNVQGHLAPTAILSLMKIAKRSGKKLSDVVTVAMPNLDDKRGRHLYAYVRRLLNQPVDYAHLCRESAPKRARQAAQAQLGGTHWVLSDGTPAEVTSSGSHVCWSGADGLPVSRPLDAAFLQAVEEGRVRPAGQTVEPRKATSSSPSKQLKGEALRDSLARTAPPPRPTGLGKPIGEVLRETLGRLDGHAGPARSLAGPRQRPAP